MDSDSRRRSVKVVRVLCDGCERASASSYCTECSESACTNCAEQLHVRGKRQSKRASARTCRGRAMKDLQKTVGVLALCVVCRTRPAYRYNSGEVYALCKECRHTYSSPAAAPAQEHDIVKRAIADDLRRSSSKSSTASPASAAAASAASRRRQKQSTHHSHNHHSHHGHHGHHKSRRERKSGEDDSTGDDISDATFSRESSAE